MINNLGFFVNTYWNLSINESVKGLLKDIKINSSQKLTFKEGREM